MASPRSSAPKRAYLFLLTSIWPCLVAALNVDICSSFNTASTAKNISIYQSNGLCHDFCQSKAAFAITQANGCWCSDYFPDKGSQIDGANCNFPCPGYPPEFCGGIGFFGYIALGEIAPSGTASPSSSSTSSSTSSSSTSKPTITTVTASITVRVTAYPPSSSSSTTSSLSSSSEMRTTSSSSTISNTTPSPPTSSSIQTVTDSSGAIRTVTVVPSLVSDSSSTKLKLSTGATAGIAVGTIVAVLIIAGGLFLFYLKRRRDNENEYRDDPSIRGSSSGMMGSTLPEMSMNGETSASPGSVGNRNSTIQIDPRMDPFKQGLYLRTGSHESLHTLRDEQDYSRRIQQPKILRATNPDPEES